MREPKVGEGDPLTTYRTLPTGPASLAHSPDPDLEDVEAPPPSVPSCAACVPR